MYLINPDDTEREAAAQGMPRTDLEIPALVFLTFSRAVQEELASACMLEEWEWPGGRFTPYSPPNQGWRGKIDQQDVAVFVPAMGASPLIAFCEELIFYGARVIHLLCASWGLGQACLEQGEIHLPSFAVGLDGTSPHYGNRDYNVAAEPRAFAALAEALDTLGAVWKKGGVGSCEAFYRITPAMVEELRQQGCLSMENGEVAALFALARERNIPIGVLLQPYIDVEQGWKTSYMGEKYAEASRLQARAAVLASKVLQEQRG